MARANQLFLRHQRQIYVATEFGNNVEAGLAGAPLAAPCKPAEVALPDSSQPPPVRRGSSGTVSRCAM